MLQLRKQTQSWVTCFKVSQPVRDQAGNGTSSALANLPPLPHYKEQ